MSAMFTARTGGRMVFLLLGFSGCINCTFPTFLVKGCLPRQNESLKALFLDLEKGPSQPRAEAAFLVVVSRFINFCFNSWCSQF